MVVTFYTICGMGPGVTNPTLDDRITDDKFCIAFDVNNSSETEQSALRKFFSETGAEEVNEKNIWLTWILSSKKEVYDTF